MILLSSLIKQYQDPLREKYEHALLPGHLNALGAMQNCRTDDNLFMIAKCDDCEHQTVHPHSCGHRSCPHCQQHQCQQWLERQRAKLLPVDYFMVTFTLPAQLRSLAWYHQSTVYAMLFEVGWQTLCSFGLSDKQLNGQMGATAVLHTHNRAKDHHPHVHFIVPAGAINQDQKLWRKKSGEYFFNENNLATVFRGKWFDAMKKAGLSVNQTLPVKWIVDCQHVGRGDKALTYLGKYLYRGVLPEKDIIGNQNGQVTFRYLDNKKRNQTRTLPGEDFLWLLLKHVLPRGFRRARDYGFLHGNCKRLIHQLHLIFHFVAPVKMEPTVRLRPHFCCPKCGGEMKIIATRIATRQTESRIRHPILIST